MTTGLLILAVGVSLAVIAAPWAIERLFIDSSESTADQIVGKDRS